MRQFAMFDRAKLLFITPSDEKNTAGRICLLGLTTGIRQESKHLRFWQHLSEWWDISKKNKPKTPVRIKMIHISCVTPAGLSMNLRVSTEAGCATSKGESNISSRFHHASNASVNGRPLRTILLSSYKHSPLKQRVQYIHVPEATVCINCRFSGKTLKTTLPW